MDSVALARLDAIEAQIKALEKEYKAVYEEIMAMARPKIVYGDELECTSCGKNKPLTEFYTTTRQGRTYYKRKCKDCEKIQRLVAVEPKRKEGMAIKINKPSKKTKVKRNYDYINEVQNEAAANGMSYGKWVAQQYAKGEKI